VNRENIKGGVSKIYCRQTGKTIFNQILLPGQGLFQKDKNTSLYHHVTQFHPIDKSKIGIRDIFGFDIDTNLR
ncbi:MAG: 2OG-Fe dioxygenase family protein, partial [Spirochaetota bacterium]